MRVNVYAEEMSNDVELITKTIEGQEFHAIRFWLYLPWTDSDGVHHKGKFMHFPGDNDSAAVTFWGKRDLRHVLLKAICILDDYFSKRDRSRFLSPDQYKQVMDHEVKDELG